MQFNGRLSRLHETKVVKPSLYEMDLSRCHNGGLGSGLVMPRHPATPPSEMMSKSGKKETKNGSPSGSINPKAAFFSISNLVNGLRQQQEKGKTLMNYNHL